jgi:hypothetical protein
LLRCSIGCQGGIDGQNVIEDQHPDSPLKGDADAQEPSAPLRYAARSISARIPKTCMADAPSGRDATGAAIIGPIAEGTSGRTSRTARRKGGVR